MNSQNQHLKHYTRRKFKSLFFKMLIVALTCIAITPMIVIFYYVFKSGYKTLNLNFLTALPVPTGEEGGGMSNALVGSATMIGLASLIGIPIGIMGGTYLSEYPKHRLSSAFRYVIDLMTSLPSIVIGLYVYAVLVVPMKGFSAYAGSAALALIMFPIVVKSTEEVLRLVSQSIREAGLALGLPRWKVITFVILKGSISSILTGILLAISRIAGETAPLLLTAFGNQFWPESLSEPTSSLTVQIYNYAISPFEDQHAQAWTGALVLLLTILLFNLIARFMTNKRERT